MPCHLLKKGLILHLTKLATPHTHSGYEDSSFCRPTNASGFSLVEAEAVEEADLTWEGGVGGEGSLKTIKTKERGAMLPAKA